MDRRRQQTTGAIPGIPSARTPFYCQTDSEWTPARYFRADREIQTGGSQLGR